MSRRKRKPKVKPERVKKGISVAQELENTRILRVTREEAELLIYLLSKNHIQHRLMGDCQRLLDEFDDALVRLRDLEKTARANGFWEEDKGIPAGIRRIKQNAKYKKNEPMGEPLSAAEVRKLVRERIRRERGEIV